MPSQAGRGQALKVEIIEGLLSISIGLDVLQYAIEMNPSDSITVTDIDVFAPEIVSTLWEESEDGTTPVHRLLDQAAGRAVENGADGVRWEET